MPPFEAISRLLSGLNDAKPLPRPLTCDLVPPVVVTIDVCLLSYGWVGTGIGPVFGVMFIPGIGTFGAGLTGILSACLRCIQRSNQFLPRINPRTVDASIMIKNSTKFMLQTFLSIKTMPYRAAPGPSRPDHTQPCLARPNRALPRQSMPTVPCRTQPNATEPHRSVPYPA